MTPGNHASELPTLLLAVYPTGIWGYTAQLIQFLMDDLKNCQNLSCRATITCLFACLLCLLLLLVYGTTQLAGKESS
jgi:hypothetical protein